MFSNVVLREVFGLTASVFVLVSMVVKSDTARGNIRMRLLNATGSILMILYGLWIGSISTIVLNVVCLTTHVYYLVGLFRNEYKDKLQAVRKSHQPRIKT